MPTNRERALGVLAGPEFRKVRFFSKEHGATAGLVLDASHFPENISAISRLFPSSEFRKMERFQKSPAFETYEDAFSYEFPEPVGTYPKPRSRKRK